MKLAWASDIHLDFADNDVEVAFLEQIEHSGAAALLLGGDIAHSGRLAGDLMGILEIVGMPVYFVLGNHDYYGSSIGRVRNRMVEHCGPVMSWLPRCGPVTLAPDIGLVGHGGWGDARLGDFAGSGVVLNDYLKIEELSVAFHRRPLSGRFGPGTVLEAELRKQGRNAADVLAPQLEMAAIDHRQVIVLTHVPPFREACWHEGGISDDHHLPAFGCGAVGEVILAAATAYPDRSFTVLCGHTHSPGRCQVLPNLVVHTQGAVYGFPTFDLITAAAESVKLTPNANPN